MTEKITALCIVAHPDDETIWMGGTISKNSEWKWTILSLCRKNDENRAPKFRKVCGFYKASPVIEDLDDETDRHISQKEVEEKILSALKQKRYDYIFTHGENGEYGHPRHVDTHKAVKNLTRKKTLSCKKLFFFSIKNNDGKISSPSDGDLVNVLTKREFAEKISVMRDLYGFAPDGIDASYCQQTEVFNLK